MKFRFLGSAVAVAACLLAPQQAHALVTTTAFVPFQIFQNPALNTGFPLNFTNFNDTFGPGASLQTLNGVRFRIAGASDGTGSATVGGNPIASNVSFFNNTQTSVSWAPQFTLTSAAGVGPAGSIVSTGATNGPNVINCINSTTVGLCPTPGGNTVPAASNRVLGLANSYSNTSTFSTIANISAWRSGSISSAGSGSTAGFSGAGVDMSYVFDPSVVPGIVAKPYISGFIALEYQYDVPIVPGASVPGPLPLVGAAAAFGWSRRLKNRISSAA
jgi:hypothetical protein